MKSFNWKKRIVSIFTIAVMSTVLSKCNTRKSETLPSFNLLMLDSSTIINTSQIPKGKAFILLFFNPDCDHCQRETKDILNYVDKLQDTKFYFVTSGSFEELLQFDKDYKLTSHRNVVVGRDYELFFFRNMKDAIPPYLIIYDRNKMEHAVFAGEVKAEKIIEVLNEIDG